MLQHPFVTVIIPNYNHAEFLEQRLLSVLNQTYSNFEVIILDDFSEDGSLTIIEKYKNNPRIKEVLINRVNTGSVFTQWVKGITLATGKYLWIAESDDYAELNFLEKMVAAAKGNGSAGLVFSDSFNIDASGNIFKTVSEKHPYLKSLHNYCHKFQVRHKAAVYFISDMLILNASSVLFDLEKLKAVLNIKKLQTFKNCGDRFVYLSIYLNYDIIYLNEPINYRREHDKNITKTNFSSGLIYKERMLVINYFFKDLKDSPSNHLAFVEYLRKNFLPALDYGFHKDMAYLTRSFYNAGLIPFNLFYPLYMYSLAKKLYKNEPPYIFRKRIKELLLISKN